MNWEVGGIFGVCMGDSNCPLSEFKSLIKFSHLSSSLCIFVHGVISPQLFWVRTGLSLPLSSVCVSFFV